MENNINRWENDFKTNPIHASLKELYDWASKDFDNQDAETFIEKRRFIKVLDYYRTVLDNLDKEIVPPDILGAINNNILTHIRPEVEQYLNTGSLSNLRNANDKISWVFGSFAQLSALSKNNQHGTPLKSVEVTFDNFVKTIANKEKGLSDHINKISESVSLQEQKLKELGETVDNRRKEVDAQLSEWLKQFSEAQHQRNIDYNGWKNQIAEEVKKENQNHIEKSRKTLDDFQTDFEALTKERLEKADSYLEDAKSKHEAILELYQLTAGDSVAAGYIKNAEDEKEQANTWRIIAIGFILLTVGAVGLEMYFKQSTDFNFVNIIRTLSITGALLSGAFYSSKQSSLHRLNEKRARWFALEVKAIDPFISSLEEKDRKELKKSFSERLFCQKNNLEEKDDKSGEHLIEVVLKGVTEILKVKK